MPNHTERVDVEELLAQRSWIERLARGLVRDPGAADDAVQDTLVAAIERPPRRIDALRPWLARVLANSVFQRRRAEERRAVHEGVAARAEELPDASELVERAELQRRLAEEVLALEEPFRRAVLLHYFDGLTSAEIARRSGTPAGSVRSQLRRGLERLRVRMDQTHGGEREVWSATLLGLAQGVRASGAPGSGSGGNTAGASASAGAAPLLGGILVMKGVLAISALAVVTAGVAMGVWWTNRSDGGALRMVDASPAVALPQPMKANETPLDPIADDASARNAIEITSESVATAAPVAPASTLATIVEARVVDGAGLELAGATITLHETGVASKSSGSDGRVSLDAGERDEPSSEVIAVRAPGMATGYRRTLLRPADTLRLGDIELLRAGTIVGVVRDGDGAIVAGLEVRATGLEDSRADREELRRLGPRTMLPVPTARTDVEGAFRLDAVAEGSVRVWAGGDGYGWASVRASVFAERTTPPVELEVTPLESDDRIRAIVLSPEGEPLAGIAVTYRYNAVNVGSGGRATTRHDGRFEVIVDHRVPHSFMIADPKRRWAPIVRSGVEPGGNEIELRFQEPRWLNIVAIDPEDQPVTEYQVEARAIEEGGLDLLGWVVETEHEGGESALLMPAEPFRLVLRAPRFAEWTLSPVDPATAECVAAELEPLAAITGRVVDSNGSPVRGAAVRLCERYGPEMLTLHDGFRALENAWHRFDSTTGHVAEQTTSDARGEFALYSRGEGSYTVRAAADGFAPTVTVPLEAGPEHARSGLELRMGNGGSIEGRVLLPVGQSIVGTIVGISRADGLPQSQRVDPEGRFRFDRLTPGPWEVRVIDAEIDPRRATAHFGQGDGRGIEWSCEVFEGELTEYDIDLRHHERSVVFGRARLGTHDMTGWTARLGPVVGRADAEVVASDEVTADGRFRLDAEPGTYRLVLSAPLESEGRLEIRETLTLAPGEREWTFDHDAGRLTGEGAPVDQRAETFFEYLWGDDLGDAVHAIVRIVPDEQGRFVLPVVPTGPAVVRSKKPGNEVTWVPWETVAEVVVAPDDTLHVRLR